MLTIILGDVGSGKTLLLTILAFASNRKVVANYKLNFDFEQFDLQKCIEQGYDESMLILDEAYVYLESRDAMDRKNKALSYVLFQSRKKNIDMYLSVQLMKTLDVRYRDMVNIIIYAERIKEGFKYTFFNMTNKQTKIVKLSDEKAEKFYKMYDTNEVIQPDMPVQEFLSHDELMVVAKQTANEINKKYEGKRITKATIKTFCFEHKIPSRIEDIIYQYCKDLRGK